MKNRKIRLLVFSIVIILGALLAVSWKTPLGLAFGINLATAGFVAILLEFVVRDEVLDDLRKRVSSSLTELGDSLSLSKSYRERFAVARESVDVLGISFTMGFENYSSQILQKIYKEPCHIRVLILAPESPLVALRARDEPGKDSEQRVRNLIEDTIERCKELERVYRTDPQFEKPPKGSFRVKTHQGIPYFGLTRFDETAFISHYFSFDHGIHSPVIEVAQRQDSLFLTRLKQHFNTIWERSDSKTVADIGFFDRRSSAIRLPSKSSATARVVEPDE